MTLPPRTTEIKNNEPIMPLTDWKKGQSLKADRFQQPVSAFNRQILKAVPPLQSLSRPRNRLIVKRFIFLEDGPDFIICQPVDEDSVTEGNLRIAKPFLLRRTLFDNDQRIITGVGTITYVYSSNSERVATNTSDEEETQVVVPAYSENEFIFAVHDIEDKTGVRINDIDIGWLDLNVDGRAWAKKSE